MSTAYGTNESPQTHRVDFHDVEDARVESPDLYQEAYDLALENLESQHGVRTTFGYLFGELPIPDRRRMDRELNIRIQANLRGLHQKLKVD